MQLKYKKPCFEEEKSERFEPPFRYKYKGIDGVVLPLLNDDMNFDFLHFYSNDDSVDYQTIKDVFEIC